MKREIVYTYTEAELVVLDKIRHNNELIDSSQRDNRVMAKWLHEEGWSVREIAPLFGCSYTTVWRMIKETPNATN